MERPKSRWVGSTSSERGSNAQDAATILDNDPDFFASYTLVICSNIDPTVESRIAEMLWKGECAPRVVLPWRRYDSQILIYSVQRI